MTGTREAHGGLFVVFAGGDAPADAVASRLPDGAFVIAADSGLGHALCAGQMPNLVIGDMDSVRTDHLRVVMARGVSVERHPVAKDETDLELAIDRAIELGASRIHVVGGSGGRLDHFFANLLLLGSPKYSAVRIVADMGTARIHVVRESIDFAGRPGDLVTLLALGGVVSGVRTSGLQYPLDGEDLFIGSTRGVSNEICQHTVSVEVRTGVLAVVIPDFHATEH